MASNRIEIAMALDTSDIAKGATDAEKHLSELEQSLDDVGSTSTDDAARGLDDIGRSADDANRSTDDAARGLDDLSRSADDASRSADDLGRSFDDSTRDMTRNADDAADALDDIDGAARDAADSADKLGRTSRDIDDVGDAARDAADDAERLERAMRDAQDETDKFGSAGTDSFGKVRDGASELSQEMGQNLGETVSSFRGDMSDLGQVGQDTLGGLAATLAGAGPAGIVGAAGLAAVALGVGGVVGEMQAMEEHAQRLEEYFADAWQTAIEGGRNYIDATTVIAGINDIIFNPERAEEYKRIQEDAKTLGLDASLLLQAAAGDQDALNTVIRETDDNYGDLKLSLEEARLANIGTHSQASEAAAEEAAEAKELMDRWQQYGDINVENQGKATAAAEATSKTLLKAIDDADSAVVATDKFGNALYRLPDGEEVVIDAETGLATRNLDTFKGDLDETGRKVVNPTVRVEVDDSAYRYWSPPMKVGYVQMEPVYDFSTPYNWNE